MHDSPEQVDERAGERANIKRRVQSFLGKQNASPHIQARLQRYIAEESPPAAGRASAERGSV